MASLEKRHEVLVDGVGACSVPMWCGGLPAGFCEAPAYGRQEPDQMRYVTWSEGWGKYFPGYCSGLACYNHGGPKAPEKKEEKPPCSSTSS